MKKIFVSIISAVVLLGVSHIASANSLKIGVIDMQQIVQKSPQIEAIKTQLSKQFKPRQEKIIASNKNVQTEVDNFNRNSATMSATDKSKLQDKIVADKANVQAQAIAYQQDLTTAQNQQMQGFMKQLNDAVTKVAQSGHYDLILIRAAAPFVAKGMDVTDQVLASVK
jgi:outer membrane protein